MGHVGLIRSKDHRAHGGRKHISSRHNLSLASLFPGFTSLCCHDSLLQGWVCPGYLVITGSSESLAAVETSWAAHSLQPPDNFRILSVGLSQSCSLKPFKQVIISLYSMNAVQYIYLLLLRSEKY